jgi:6-phosphogluconolactonase (cycloisomerase 2 family)
LVGFSIQTRPSDLEWLIFAGEDWLYTLHETTSTLSVQKISNDPHGESAIIATASIIPPNPPAGAIFAAAEILIPCPSYQFPFPYIYVSNRNTGVVDPRGDTIAIFEHVNRGRRDEGLRLVRQIYTGLDQIRGMEFGPAPQEYLIAGGANGSTGVVMFQRTESGRNLEVVVRNFEIANRTSFVWI